MTKCPGCGISSNTSPCMQHGDFTAVIQCWIFSFCDHHSYIVTQGRTTWWFD